MKPRYRLLLLLVAGTLALGSAAFFRPPSASSEPRLLHSESSQFGKVLVFEELGERCMNFNSMTDTGRQTCISLEDPDKMVFAYTRMMTTALFAKPNPGRILIVGLGGATLPTALARIVPEATIDTVEIDPAVVRVAETYFGYKPGPRQRVFVEDGRAFIGRVHKQGGHYDIVMLDAFDDDYIPAHLLTREFFALIKEILSPDGLLVSNSFTTRPMYDRESATYAAVFGEFFELRSGLAGNRVVIASPDPLPDQATLQANAAALASRLRPFGIEAEEAVQRFGRTAEWDKSAPVLTDAELR